MSEENTQTPLYREIFQAFESGVAVEKNRAAMQMNSFPLSNVRAFPIVVAAYFDPESDETTAAVENPTQGLDMMSVGEYVTGLILTDKSTQVNITNIAGVVPAYSKVTNQFNGSSLSESDAQELTAYLFSLMRTIPAVNNAGELAYVFMADGEESELATATTEEVEDLITSLITSPRFHVAFSNDAMMTFALWDSAEDEQPSLSGRILFTTPESAAKITAPSDEEETGE